MFSPLGQHQNSQPPQKNAQLGSHRTSSCLRPTWKRDGASRRKRSPKQFHMRDLFLVTGNFVVFSFQLLSGYNPVVTILAGFVPFVRHCNVVAISYRSFHCLKRGATICWAVLEGVAIGSRARENQIRLSCQVGCMAILFPP